MTDFYSQNRCVCSTRSHGPLLCAFCLSFHFNCLHDSSLSTFGDKVRKSQRIVPGWNEHVSELHAHARCCYVIWRNCGKPRQGTEHADMKISRARFKLIFRECLRNEETMKADAIAAKLKNKDTVEFWRKVTKLKVKRKAKCT